MVSDPEASSLAALVVPAGHAMHEWLTTIWSAPHRVASQVVSDPVASSLAALVVPAGHAVHEWFTTI